MFKENGSHRTKRFGYSNLASAKSPPSKFLWIFRSTFFLLLARMRSDPDTKY